METKKIWMIGCSIFAALAILTVLSIVAAGYFTVGWAKDTTEEMKRDIPKIESDANRFASGGKSANDCLNEGLKRLDECFGALSIKCQVRVRLFTDKCIDLVPVDPTFCEGVPERTAIFDLAFWAEEECSKRGSEHSQCGQFIQSTVADRCHPL